MSPDCDHPENAQFQVVLNPNEETRHDIGGEPSSKDYTTAKLPSTPLALDQPRFSGSPKEIDPAQSSADGLADTGQSTLVEGFRLCMRHSASSLVIVTSFNDGSEPDDEVFGMLAASFTPVSLHPDPYVSFNIKLPSRTYEQMARKGKFMVFAPRDATLCAAFAAPGPKHTLIQEILTRRRALFSRRRVLWWARCQLLQDKSITVGDHMIVVGKVTQVQKPQPIKTLDIVVYADREYHTIGPRLQPLGGTGSLHRRGIRKKEKELVAQKPNKALGDSKYTVRRVSLRPNKMDVTISQCDPISTAAAFKPPSEREQEQYEKAAMGPTDQEYGTGDMASAAPRKQRSDVLKPSDEDEHSCKSPPLRKHNSKRKRPPSSREFAPVRPRGL